MAVARTAFSGEAMRLDLLRRGESRAAEVHTGELPSTTVLVPVGAF
jgi:hypothetical protein